MLNFAKLEVAHVRYSITAVPIRESISARDALIAPQVTTKQLCYETAEIDPSLHADGDEEQLQQILLNCSRTPSSSRNRADASR